MQVADHDEAGCWEQRGWDREAVVRTMSASTGRAPGIGAPRRLATASFPATGARLAWVRVGGGATWLEAELEGAVTPRSVN
jgi:hypothetical protein